MIDTVLQESGFLKVFGIAPGTQVQRLIGQAPFWKTSGKYPDDEQRSEVARLSESNLGK
jgi:hypothetical protein